MEVLTAGHSLHPIEKLVGLLSDAGVTAVADVRSRPYSGMAPRFNAPSLAAALDEAGISYVPMGAQLGGQPEDESLWRDGRPDFAAMSASPGLHAGAQRIASGAASGQRICLLCSEEDPAICHRHRLLAPVLAGHGVTVVHLRGDGSREPAEAAEGRVPAAMRRQWQAPLF